MRTVFFGTSDFAVTVLERLVESEHRPALVVTPVDRPRGRGRRLASPPAADAARELGVELLQTEDASESRELDRVLAMKPQAGVVCAFGQRIREQRKGAMRALREGTSYSPEPDPEPLDHDG